MGTAIYTRVSTDEQVNGFGLDVQREKCLAMATVKGWDISNEYSDEGISGTKDETHRPGLAAMLEAARVGEIDGLIVAAIDRLGRNTRLVLRLSDFLKEKNVNLISCKESFDTSTPTGTFVLTMFAALAKLDRDNIVERTTDGRDARGRIDGEKGGRMPLGYTRDETGPVVVPQEAAIVRQIFELRQQGLILQAIADEMNRQGISSKQGGNWYPSTVNTILRNEDKYRGGVRGYSPVYWPQILEG